MIMYNSNKESDSPWFENGTQSNFKKISQLQVTNRKEQSLNSENMKASYEEQSVISPITNSLMELYGMNNSQIGQKLKNQQQQQQLWEAAASPSLGLKQESFINSNLSSNIDNSSNSKANMNNTNSNINYLPYQPQQQQAMLGTRYAYQWPWQQQSFSKPNISNNIVNHSNIFTDNLSSPDVELQQTSPMHLKPLNVSSKSPTSYPGEPYPRLVKINNSQSHESQYQDNNSNRNLSDTTSDPTQQIESEDINLKRKVSSDYSEYDSEKNEIGNDK